MVAALVLLVVAAGAVAAFALDPRVELAGIGVGDRGQRGVTAAAEEVAARYESADVVVRTPDGDIETRARELGLEVDVPATTEAALEAAGGPIDRIRSLVTPVRAPVIVTVDQERVRDLVERRDPTGRQPPVEPSIGVDSGSLGVRPGEPGEGLDHRLVADAVVEAARHGSLPIEADAEATVLPPRFSRAEAEALADRARRLVDEPLEVEAGGFLTEVPSSTLLSWIESEPGDDALELALDADEALDDLATLLAEAGEAPVDARMTVEGGRPVIVRGRNGTRCCAEAAVPRILDALTEGNPRPVSLPMQDVEPDRTSAHLEALQIVEEVGSFTTRFQSGQSRVVNIHRIADLMRGTLIGPGGRLSVNDKIGRRTAEKGFVSGGVIQDGVFAESIGGGISQFATTLFNAAFFAGLEIPEYQSHSIYISRYPYGREATLSFPKPDLVIGNPSPHGVLVWPTYTSSSVTVTIYSTRWATGEQTGQSESQVGECTRVRTQRTRTFVDGRTETDFFFATYRPEEGVRC